MTSTGSDDIEIKLVCCLNVRAISDGSANRAAPMLDMLRLADRMQIRPDIQVTTAIPTLDAVAAQTFAQGRNQ